MSLLKGAQLPACPSNLNCSQWARTYLKYCLCSGRDEASLVLGIISIVSWAIAEVPQIIKNYKGKSAEGLSIAFLAAWIFGDIFNFVGCILEPATLPTQFYMAVLYGVTSITLSGQTIYYGHIYQRFKIQKLQKECAPTEEKLLGDQKTCGELGADGKSPSDEDYLPSLPIPYATQVLDPWSSQGIDLYFTSARSLSKSPVPSWTAYSSSNTKTPPLSHNQPPAREPLPDRLVPATSPSPNVKNMLSLVPLPALFLGIFILNHFVNNTTKISNGVLISSSRKLLQVNSYDNGSTGIGNLLGWAMAVIYIGGRLPQIFLNIKRGDIQGLSPLMFLFALVGNATYMGSILVKSLEWTEIKPNLPWLVDAGGCLALDTFILLQFAYYRHRKNKASDNYAAFKGAPLGD